MITRGTYRNPLDNLRKNFLAASYLCGFGPDVQHLVILIPCAPEIIEAAVDLEEHFFEIPYVAGKRRLVT
jgi:hypothetical protein